MSPFKPRHSEMRRAAHGATRRRQTQSSAFDRWLDRLVSAALLAALLVSATALLLSRL